MSRRLDSTTPRMAVAMLLAVLSLLSQRTQGATRDVNMPADSNAVEKASLVVHADQRSPYTVPRFIMGKFCEHLYFNVTNGMDAQILKNPTFADYPFSTGETSPDGVATFHYRQEDIARAICGDATRWGWPRSDIDGLVRSRNEAVACWWAKLGDVQASPDTGPCGGRAQRIATRASGQGLMQWTWLPLHRIRKYEVQVWVRSPNLEALSVAFLAPDGNACAKQAIRPITADWQRLNAHLEIPADLPADKAYRFTITADRPGQFVISRLLLLPADHVNRADPDVIRFLKESRLPLLRWPGGNFASTYHWRDGVGPLEQRRTLPNYAWGQQENNFFGTDEFIAFCRAVGCEPMICINAGSGTPQEAAEWIEYCNGDTQTPMGKLRAANGNPKPYHVKYWEVGNELWGAWQYHWTTAEGYVDRYRQFVKAMRAVDPSIKLYACGAPAMWGKQWNGTLIAGAPDLLRAITDHPLIGGQVPADTDPLDVFRDFMAVPEVLEQKWANSREDMIKGGIAEPRLAVTELQMFASVGGLSSAGAPRRLTHDTLVNPSTQAEALYDVLIYHAAIRQAPFVEMVTHSATVNHGGGLRKTRERVFANPCYYAQSMFAAFAEATPVKTDLTCPVQKAPLVLPDLRHVTDSHTGKVLDALAAQTTDGALLLSLVHKGAQKAIDLKISLDGVAVPGPAQIQTLSADVPWATNTLETPIAIAPVIREEKLSGHVLELRLPRYTYTLVRIPKR